MEVVAQHSLTNVLSLMFVALTVNDCYQKVTVSQSFSDSAFHIS